MPREMWAKAIEPSAGREPIVRAMVLMQGARVLAYMDRAGARRIFAEGLTLLDGIDPRQLRWLLQEAVMLGAQADPVATIPLLRRLRTPGAVAAMVVQALAQDRDFDTALAVMDEFGCDPGVVQVMISQSADPLIRSRVANAAREQWSAARHREAELPNLSLLNSYYQWLSQNWQQLDPREAPQWIEEALQAIETDPDMATSHGFGNQVHFDSSRDAFLFLMLSALRALRPREEVDSILARHLKVEAAARIYPLGVQSMMSETPKPGEREAFLRGLPEHARRSFEIMNAAHDGDRSVIPILMEEARELYQEDTDPDNPNQAPRVAWPSCNAYRKAFYWAGRILGASAELLLAEMRDPDIAIMSRIELVAGILGAPHHGGTNVQFRPNG